MKTRRTNIGPFKERPFYSLEEIERMCSDELQSVGLYPTSPAPIRIDRFLEKRFKINVSYEDLPRGILGFTEFGSKGPAAIVVSKSLDDGKQSSERRIRTTLAHEGGHGLLHAHLMVMAPQTITLFEGDRGTQRPKILCREDGPSNVRSAKYDGKWWEFQANQAMGALLLPRSLVEEALRELLVSSGSFGRSTIAPAQRAVAAEILSQTFEVNQVAARLRLDTILPSADRQLTL